MSSFSGVRPAGRSTSGEVEAQLADAQLVAVAQFAHRGRLVVAVADAAVDVDAGRGHEAERDREDQRGQDEPAAPADESRDRRARRRRRSRGRRPPRRRRAPHRRPRPRSPWRRRRAAAGRGRCARRRSRRPRCRPRPATAATPTRPTSARPIRGGARKNRPGPSSTSAAMASTLAPAIVAARLGPSGALAGHRVGRDEHPARDVGEHAGAAGQREHDEPDAEDDRVDVEVAAEPSGHAAEHLVGGGAGQPPRLRPAVAIGSVGPVGCGSGCGSAPGRAAQGPAPSGSPEVIGSSGFSGWSGWSGGVGASGMGRSCERGGWTLCRLSHQRVRAYRECPLGVPRSTLGPWVRSFTQRISVERGQVPFVD